MKGELSERLAKLSTATLVMIGLLLLLAVGLADYLTGWELSFSVFYLLPVSLVAWHSRRWAAIAMAILSGVTWLLADLASGRPYSHGLIPYWNASVRLDLFLIVALLLSALRRQLDSERVLATQDPLTRLLNRRGFLRAATEEVARARRHGRPFTVVSIDLDGFKSVNDRFGHSEGDALLCAVASVMGSRLRTTDLVARAGGDEFVLLLAETGGEPAGLVLSNLRDSLLATMEERHWPVTFSIGALTFVVPPESVDEMIQRSDKLMYSAKRGGKNLLKHEVVGGG